MKGEVRERIEGGKGSKKMDFKTGKERRGRWRKKGGGGLSKEMRGRLKDKGGK